MLGNPVLLTLKGYGHPTYQLPSQCIDNWRARYLVHLITPKRGTVCQLDRQPFALTSANHFRASQLPYHRRDDRHHHSDRWHLGG